MMQRVLTILLIVIVCSSCSSDDDTNDRRVLNENRQLWEASQIENYSWNERLSCFCAAPLERNIFVVDGVKNRVDFDESVILPENLEEFRELIFNRARTVEEAFNFVEELLNEDVASFSIEYDSTYGFPTLINVDYIENASDDEIGYIYTDFTVEN